MHSPLEFWDFALIAGVSLQTVAMAYVHTPRRKAFVYSLPVPFTLAALAVGEPMNADNLAGFALLLVYVQTVRLLHQEWHWPITLSIASGVALYCGVALILVRFIPHSDVAFWFTCFCTMLLAILLLLTMPRKKEPNYRTPLPVWIKLPIIVCVVVLIVLAKRHLHGFTTSFPMVGVVGAYEARHSLWTMGRQIPLIMLSVGSMIVTCRLLQGHYGLHLALAVSWLVFAVVMTLAMRTFNKPLPVEPV